MRKYLRRVMEDRACLTRDEARDLLRLVLDGQAAAIELAALLGAMAARGETAEELAGFVDAMLEAAVPFPLDEAERALLVDSCGTGGDGAETFNISTGAALVAAAAGAKVAKHGNRAVTSKSGSADVLEALGVPVGLSPIAAAAAIRAHGFAYLHAPVMHPAMKAVMPVRKALGVRTVFNLLGPLANPAGVRSQVMGVYAADRVQVAAEAMLLLGVRHAFVVHGLMEGKSGAGMDEFSVSGDSILAEVRNGAVLRRTVTPEELGLERASIAMLRGGDAAMNAAVLKAVFEGKPGPCRDVMMLNAAAVLVVAGRVPGLRQGIELAQRTVDSGGVLRLLVGISGKTAHSSRKTEAR